jgi:hypothetical protein
MQPLKVSIPGDFWDTRVYRGRLYLWDMNGRLATYDWDRLVNWLGEKVGGHLVTDTAFARSDLAYGPSSDATRYPDIRHYSEFREWLLGQFQTLSTTEFVVEPELLAEFLIGEQDSPFKELPSDTEIYRSILFGADDQGLWKATLHRRYLRYPVSSKAERIWDGPVFSITAKLGRLGLAGGGEGLFECDVEEDGEGFMGGDPRLERVAPRVTRLSARHCSRADWAYSSLYSSGDSSAAYMAAFARPRPEDSVYWQAEARLPTGVVFVDEIAPEEIFGSRRGFTWGGHDKVYLASGEAIAAVRFAEWDLLEQRNRAFRQIGEVAAERNGAIISAGAGLFGIVMEFDDGLKVVESNGATFRVAEPVTRWRVFPRSIRYENHVHVVMEDRLDILSFNGELETDEDRKIVGIRYGGWSQSETNRDSQGTNQQTRVARPVGRGLKRRSPRP